MIDRVSDDRLLIELSQLPELSPEALRAARIRTRCRARLARRARIGEPAANPESRVLAPVVVLGACGVYVYSLVTTVLRLTGIL